LRIENACSSSSDIRGKKSTLSPNVFDAFSHFNETFFLFFPLPLSFQHNVDRQFPCFSILLSYLVYTSSSSSVISPYKKKTIESERRMMKVFISYEWNFAFCCNCRERSKKELYCTKNCTMFWCRE